MFFGPFTNLYTSFSAQAVTSLTKSCLCNFSSSQSIVSLSSSLGSCSLCVSLSLIHPHSALSDVFIFSFPFSSVVFSVSGLVIEEVMTVNGVISGPTGRCCAKRCIPRELEKLVEEGRAPTGSHLYCVFHPHLFFLSIPIEPAAGMRNRQL